MFEVVFYKIQSRYIIKNQSVKMLPYCESTEAFVWGKSQKIIANSCQGFQEEWWGPRGFAQQ